MHGTIGNLASEETLCSLMEPRGRWCMTLSFASVGEMQNLSQRTEIRFVNDQIYYKSKPDNDRYQTNVCSFTQFPVFFPHRK